MPFENFYNLTLAEAKNLGNAIGCDFSVILKSENLRRNSFAKSVYYEAYAAVFLVSSRTGKLVFWNLRNFEEKTAEEADQKLEQSIGKLADEIKKQAADFYLLESGEVSLPKIEELPVDNSPEARDFTPPLPYKRLRPQYTKIADLYGIAATVEATVDIDENGQVTRIDITRWAGFELDEAVAKVITKMTWRPASRNGKTLPLRVLLRYNFRKIEKDE